MERAPSRIAVLFSGGTDSTASSALLTESFDEIHLLSYNRLGFYGVENSKYNHGKLAERFPNTRFIHHIYETTPLAKYITNHRRWQYIKKYNFFTLQNCGFCALINHVSTLAYCVRHGIADCADGITYDWPFFPGHMDKIIDRFRTLYRSFDITYHTPVLHFDVDEPIYYIDKFRFQSELEKPGSSANTTGKLLQRLGLSDVDNYKGTATDRKAQARCYQFVLPNLFIYWIFRGQERWQEYEEIVLEYFGELTEDARQLLEQYFERNAHKRLFAFLDEPAPFSG